MGESSLGRYSLARTNFPELRQEVDRGRRNVVILLHFFSPRRSLRSGPREKFELSGRCHQVGRIRLDSCGLDRERVQEKQNAFQSITEAFFLTGQQFSLGDRRKGEGFLREEHVKNTSYTPYVGGRGMGDGLVPYVLRG